MARRQPERPREPWQSTVVSHARPPRPIPRRCPCPRRRPRRRPGRGPADPAGHPGAVTSPMVGTVLPLARAGCGPFVKVGDKVAEGQTVLIIEAMKTMNQIPAPRAGTVKRILVEDGDARRIRRAPHDHRIGARPDVRQDPDRQPGRDRPPRDPRLPRDGHRPSPCIPPPTPTRCMSAWPTKRLHRPAALGAKLPLHPRHHLGLRDHGRPGDPPGLRLPVRERQLRADRRRSRITFIGPSARTYPHHGRQDHRQGHDAETGVPCVPGSDGGVPDMETR
jgi:biotin carboxyl carrier protein